MSDAKGTKPSSDGKTSAVMAESGGKEILIGTTLDGLVMSEADPLLRCSKGRGPEDAKKMKSLLESMDPYRRHLVVNQYNASGSTLLFHAAWNGNKAMVETILEYDGNPNVQNLKQNTSLHMACERKHRDVMLLLVQHGADISLTNLKGQKCWECVDDIRLKVDFENELRKARDTYITNNPHFDTMQRITEEEYNQYKTMYDAMDEDLDGVLTPHEMQRLFNMIPLGPDFKDMGITEVTFPMIKEFNDEMAITGGGGVCWRDFLRYVYKAKLDAAGGKGKKKKKKKK